MQVGSNDLTLVNLHLATLPLPGGENPSKNHGDSHRVASFAQTLQETLKGGKRSFSVAGPQLPFLWGSQGVASLAQLSDPIGQSFRAAAVPGTDSGDGGAPASVGSQPPRAW